MGRIVELKKTLQKLAQSRTWEKDFAEAMLLVQRGATIAISISVAVVRVRLEKGNLILPSNSGHAAK